MSPDKAERIVCQENGWLEDPLDQVLQILPVWLFASKCRCRLEKKQKKKIQLEIKFTAFHYFFLDMYEMPKKPW